MKHSKASQTKLTDLLKSSSLPLKGISQSLGTKDSELQLALLSCSLTMMSIAQQLGLKMSLRFSRKKA